MSDPRHQEERADGAGREPADDGLIAALPGLARIYAAGARHTAEWTVSSALRAASRMARSFTGDNPPPGELVEDAAREVRDYARRMRDIIDPGSGDPDAATDREDGRDDGADSLSALRGRGEELLRRSADLSYSEDAHPAYGRILSQLAPDEARILRLLAEQGPQPSVDVRSGLPLASSLVAPGLNMIGAEAGCRYPERVPSYLNNLYRLGLIWFSREPLPDRLRYQVLEAQPDVLEAMAEGSKTARTVRRSIVLTPFGRDFCAIVLPDERGAAPQDGA